MKNFKSLLLLLALPLLLTACNGDRQPATSDTNTTPPPAAVTEETVVDFELPESEEAEEFVESAATSEPEVLIDIDNLDLENVPDPTEIIEIEGFVPPEEAVETSEDIELSIEGFVPPEEVETVPAE